MGKIRIADKAQQSQLRDLRLESLFISMFGFQCGKASNLAECSPSFDEHHPAVALPQMCHFFHSNQAGHLFINSTWLMTVPRFSRWPRRSVPIFV
jgi:hypothetical protein